MTEAQMNAMWDRDDPQEFAAAAQRMARSKDAQKAARRFFERIENPLLLDVEVDWNGLPVSDIYPREIPDVFSAAPIILKGRYAQPSEGDILVQGRQGGQTWQQTVHVVLPAQSQGAPDASALSAVWARERLEDLEVRQWLSSRLGNGTEDSAQLQTDIEETALRYKLMSRYTSFVAVEEKITNPGGAQETADTPIELAEGLSANGFFQQDASDASSNYAVSSGGGGFSSQAGDPLILVKAPADAAQVIAILPGGEIKRLHFVDGQWQARFDIPTYASEGDYVIQVIIVNQNGARRTLALHYTVDSTPTTAKGRAFGKDSQVHLKLQTGAEANRVVALLPWGTREELKSQNGVFSKSINVPQAWRHRAAKVTFIVTDRAHNRTVITVDLEK
jgi:Ca-activated chloride channel family protein